MTNTLHRFGDAASFHDDFIVFAIASKGRNDAGALEILRTFLKMAVPFRPVNLGDARKGGSVRPDKQLNPLSHWDRDNAPRIQAVIDGLEHVTTVAAVFDNQVAAENFVAAVRKADLGVSINISTSINGAVQCCQAAQIPRHSIGYSLGFEGKTEKLPDSQVLMLTTMCGHGMIAASLGKKMLDWVKEGRRTPAQAASYMQRFCSCGVFNPSRACRLLEEARSGQH